MILIKFIHYLFQQRQTNKQTDKRNEAKQNKKKTKPQQLQSDSVLFSEKASCGEHNNAHLFVWLYPSW